MDLARKKGLVVFAALAALALGGCKLDFRKADKEPAPRKDTEVFAFKFGYHPEDATKALQEAINSGAGRVVVENVGTPWIVDKIQLESNQEIFFQRGVVVQAKRGAFKGGNDCLFTASLKKNVTLIGYGATFKMWKEDYHGADYQKAEWRHTLSIRSSQNVKVVGLTLAGSGGDGIYLGVAKRGQTNKNVHIKDVVCVDNNRQGISVISAENLLIENTIMKDTWGTAPQAGIDFEPNESSEKLVNIVMRNCLSDNNRGDAYAFYIPTLNARSAPVSIRLENCESRGCARAVSISTGNDPAAAVKGRIEFVNCTFEGSKHSGIVVSRKPVIGCKVRFENCAIINCAEQPVETPIAFVSGSNSSEPIGGVAFINCTIRDAVERLPISYMDSSGGLRLADITGNLTVERQGGRTAYTLDRKLLEKWLPHTALREFKKFLAQGVRYEPVDPAAAPAPSWKYSARQRGQSAYLLWAEAGRTASFAVLVQPVGQNQPKAAPVCLISPSGKKTPLADAPAGETPYSFAAAETGAYIILCEPGHATTQVYSVTNRVCQYSESGAIHFLGTEGRFYFWVPRGVTEFGVRVSGENLAERVKAALYDAGGNLIEEKDDLAQAHQFIGARADASKGEVWSLRLSRPSHGILEDFHVRLQGIPPVLSGSPETLLRPAK